MVRSIVLYILFLSLMLLNGFHISNSVLKPFQQYSILLFTNKLIYILIIVVYRFLSQY